MSRPLISYIPDFLDYCEVEKGLSYHTIRNYRIYLAKLGIWLQQQGLDGLKPENLSPTHVWDYRLYLSRFRDKKAKKGYSKTTQNYFLVALRAFLKFLAKRQVSTLGADQVDLPKKDPRPLKFLQEGQMRRLLEAPDPTSPSGLRDRTILEVLFSTGLRVAELTALNRDQINLGSGEIGVIGKGGKPRVVFLSDSAKFWLSQYLEKRTERDKALFIHLKGRIDDEGSLRLTARSVQRIVENYVKGIGLPVKATPHSIRHSFATDLLMQGADLRSVQEMLGHSNVATTQIYTHVTNSHLKDVHKAFHSGNKFRK